MAATDVIRVQLNRTRLFTKVMGISIREARPDELEQLIPLLRQAEESERALRWGLAHLVDAVYRMDDGKMLVGVATMQWRDDPCEIMELAIAPQQRRRGLGRHFVTWLIDEARRRGKRQLIVGTANSSIGNILFYQRCGLRMDHVRQDYFWYYREPVYENGIQVRDMLVFHYDLVEDTNQAHRRRTIPKPKRTR